MPAHDAKSADFISIVVADSTRIHTQLLAEAMRSDQGLHVVASASTSEELLAAVVRVPVDVTSTMGDAPDTVIVSSSEPTFKSALRVIVKFAGSSTPSRETVEKPASVKVTL